MALLDPDVAEKSRWPKGWRWLGANWLPAGWLLIFWAIVFVQLLEYASMVWPGGTEVLRWIAGALFAGAAAVSFRNMAVALTLSWVISGLGLIGTWLRNLDGPMEHRALSFGLFVLASMFFFVLEGLELAYTELRDKDSEQLPEVKDIIAEINEDRAVFYDARELLVVFLVMGLTVASTFDTVHLPVLGPVKGFWCVAFSLVFTSLLIIWLAQGPAKMLATNNSLAFLRKCGFAWFWRWMLRPLGKAMKKVRIAAPAELILVGLKKLLPDFQKKRDLAPSRRVFYLDALRSYGYSVHFVEEHVEIAGDGTATLDAHSLVLITEAGARPSFYMYYYFDAPVTSVEFIKEDLYSIPPFGEVMTEEYEANLRAIFDRTSQPPGFILHEKALHRSDDTGVKPTEKEKVHFRWDAYGDNLPGCLVVENKRAKACAARIHVRVKLEKGAFKVPPGAGHVHDQWKKTVHLPYGHYQFRVEVEGGLNMRLSSFKATASIWGFEHPAELKRLRDIVEETPDSPARKHVVVDHPLAGTECVFEWDLWRRE